MNIHFYWNGDDFQFLNRLTLISHVNVGHHPIMWLDGKIPNSKYWINDINEIEIRNINEIYNTEKEYKKGANCRTISTLFSWEIVKQTGEYTADCDAIALRKWPDQNILLAGSEPEHINVGVFRLPKTHPVLNECINNFLPTWGNVKVFTKYCRKYGLNNNVPISWFYPVHWGGTNNISKTLNCRGLFFDNIKLPDPCYSYHYYSNTVSKVGCDHTWINNPKLKNSLFFKLIKQNFKNFNLQNH
jgi:hypothetical protein